MRSLIAALVLAAAPHAGLAEPYRGYEGVPYTVEQRAGDVEIRSYPPRTIAEVVLQGDRRAAINRGFRDLFAFITGANGADEKIAMTVPVGQTETPRGWSVRFYMPEGTAPDALPTPDNRFVGLRRLPAEHLLVGRFTGLATSERLASAESALRRYADAQGLRLIGPPRYMFYDGPFRAPWARRNEVAFPLAP